MDLSSDQMFGLSDPKSFTRPRELRYQETLLYGQHSYAPLSKFAQEESRRAKEEKRKRDQLKRVVTQASRESKLLQRIKAINRRWISFSYTELGRKINDAIFLTLLGISVSVISFMIDIIVGRCRQAQMSLLSSLNHTMIGQYISWVLFFIVFTCFSVGSTHLIAPTAIGSGIPEVKTMLRGVVMKEYLGLRTLAAKVIGLTTALSSGLPIGKEGSFVHIGVLCAALIAKLLPAFSSSLENHESRLGEILLPGSAVGLSCTFAAPVGALLYSLESTSVNFAIRNYWRSFYASAVGSLMYRLVASWFKEGERMTALRETHLPQDRLFDPSEFMAFSFLGMIVGFLGVLFILMHKHVVLAVRNVGILKRFFTSNRFIYPTLVALLVGTFQYPPWLGQYYGGELTNTEALNDLYSNFTWTTPHYQQHHNFDYDVIKQKLLHHWSVSSSGGVLMATALFCLMRLWMCSLSTTVPFPCGLIFPAFAIGSALGRLFGETMAIIFPAGIRGNEILPGGYAVVGSVAFVGAVTHTFSPVVIALELTGQMGHALPSLLAVMIANAISRNLTSSVYDCILQIKRLPFLPINIQTSSKIKTAEDIMQRDMKVLTESSSYGEAATLLMHHQFKSFPIVNNRSSMVLLGSIERSILKQVVRDQLCLQNKVEFYSKKLERVMMKKRDGDDILLNCENGDGGGGGGGRKRSRNGVGGEDDALMSDLEWRNYELIQMIDLKHCPYDSAPFQISMQTPVHQVHKYFSLLNLHHTFVTQSGRLVGIISLREVRKTIQVQVEDDDALNEDEVEKNEASKSYVTCCSSKLHKNSTD